MFQPLSLKAEALKARLLEFMAARVYPHEVELLSEARGAVDRWGESSLSAALKGQAREAGLWNLFYNHGSEGAGLSNYEYSHLCEILGRSLAAPELFNCNAPDVGNMEILAVYGSPAQKANWLTR